MIRKCRVSLVFLGVMLPAIALPLGLGELRLQSFLNEPLRAEVDLLDLGSLDPGQLKVRLASKSDFDRAGVERNYFLTGLKFSISTDKFGSGGLLITSADAVVEPYLDFVVEVRWPEGRILRAYTLLLDLPALAGSASDMTVGTRVPVAAETVSVQTGADEDVQATDDGRYWTVADAAPQPGGMYLVQQSETLWSIASRSRPAGSSVQQTMFDIRRLNPEAFIDGNINQLKAGYVLRLPTPAEMSDMAAAEVAAQIEQQASDWRENLGAIDARSLDSGADNTSSASTGAHADQGSLVIAGNSDSQSAAAIAGGVGTDLEQLDAVQRDNDDLRDQMRSMEEQMATLERLLTLKDDQIAALQSALSDEDTATPAETGGRNDTTSHMLDVVVEPATDTSVTTAPSANPTPAPKPAAQQSASDELMTLLMDYLIYVVALLLVLTGALLWAFRNILKPGGLGRQIEGLHDSKAPGQTGDIDDGFVGVELNHDGLIVDQFSDLSEDESLGSERLSFSTADEDVYAAQFESGNVLAEADIYIAYGRFPQAVAALKAAIAVEPTHVEYRLKLMQAHLEMADSKELQQQYADLQAIGDQAAIARARELIEATSNGKGLLQNLPEPTLTAEEVTAATVEQYAEASPASSEAEPGLDDEGVASASSEDDSDLEHVDVNDFHGGSEDSEDELKEVTPDDALIELPDLELDKIITAVEPADEELELGNDPDDDPLAAGLLDELSLNEDLPQPQSETDKHINPAAEPKGDSAHLTALPTALAGASDDLGIDFGDLKIEGEMSEIALEAVADEFEDSDLNLEKSLEDLTTDFDDALDDETISEDEDLVFAADGDAISTKLDLARAYIDMGDQEGAKSILEEVMQDGAKYQKREAQGLIDHLD